eukprot:747117-Hanusia_phi.AAC.8
MERIMLLMMMIELKRQSMKMMCGTGHVTIVANMFIIREINLADKENFLGSTNMFPIAQKKGWWTPGSKFDFTAIFSDGEYAHKFYTGRRIWRAYDILAPSRKFPSTYDEYAAHKILQSIPFQHRPGQKGSACARRNARSCPLQVELATIMAIMKDSLEVPPSLPSSQTHPASQGTPFDMTAGLAAGPFGTPDRWIGGDGELPARSRCFDSCCQGKPRSQGTGNGR